MTPDLGPADERSEMPEDEISEQDPDFQQQLQRLYQVRLYTRWVILAILWVTIAPFCLWVLRSEIALWLDYFTWTAVRFTFAYNPLPTFGLLFCITLTVSTLLWQSHYLLFGLSSSETTRLKQQLFKIRQQGASHPLWKWVCQDGEK